MDSCEELTLPNYPDSRSPGPWPSVTRTSGPRLWQRPVSILPARLRRQHSVNLQQAASRDHESAPRCPSHQLRHPCGGDREIIFIMIIDQGSWLVWKEHKNVIMFASTIWPHPRITKYFLKQDCSRYIIDNQQKQYRGKIVVFFSKWGKITSLFSLRFNRSPPTLIIGKNERGIL